MSSNRGCDFEGEMGAQAKGHEANLRAHSDGLRGVASTGVPGGKPMPKTPEDPLDVNDKRYSKTSGGHGPGGGRIPPDTTHAAMQGTPGGNHRGPGGGLGANTAGKAMKRGSNRGR